MSKKQLVDYLKMKKILLIMVLGLLLSGCFYDETKRALENCADKTFMKIEAHNLITKIEIKESKIMEKKIKEKLNNEAYYYYYGDCEASLKHSEIRFKEKWK